MLLLFIICVIGSMCYLLYVFLAILSLLFLFEPIYIHIYIFICVFLNFTCVTAFLFHIISLAVQDLTFKLFLM